SSLQAQVGNIELIFTEGTQEPRTLFVGLDSGQTIPPLPLPERFESYSLTINNVPAGERMLTLLAPGEGNREAAWWAPRTITVNAQLTTAVFVELQPVETRSVLLEPPNDWQNASSTNAILTCERPDSSTQLVGRAAGLGALELEIFPTEGLELCELIASATFEDDEGNIENVAFELGIETTQLAGQVELKFPRYHRLVPTFDQGEHRLSWPAVDQATVYDVYIARDNGSTQLSEPLWSCTTEQPTIVLPNLPDEAIALLDLDEEAGYVVRVVARFVPSLDIENNWNWTDYHGYVSS
ncbi:MAG: hypothetical protein AAFX99_36870, partial [Myxococcota bacterium]